jgi:hypothetical protein
MKSIWKNHLFFLGSIDALEFENDEASFTAIFPRIRDVIWSENKRRDFDVKWVFCLYISRNIY